VEANEALALGTPFYVPPSRCFARRISSFLVTNLLSTYIIHSEADLSNGATAATVMCKYFAFKGPSNSNCKLVTYVLR